MATWIQIDVCPVKGCAAPVFAEMVPADREPRIRVSCRCREIYPDAFKRPGEFGYATGLRAKRRRVVH